jgi:transcriptional regulator with XRE-family HTH domain
MSKIPNLFELLQEKGVSQKELSVAVGVSEGNVSDWKKGKCIPSADTLSSIADYLGTTVNYLLGKSDKKNKLTADDIDYELITDEERLILLFRELSPEQKKMFLRAAGMNPEE